MRKVLSSHVGGESQLLHRVALEKRAIDIAKDSRGRLAILLSDRRSHIFGAFRCDGGTSNARDQYNAFSYVFVDENFNVVAPLLGLVPLHGEGMFRRARLIIMRLPRQLTPPLLAYAGKGGQAVSAKLMSTLEELDSLARQLRGKKNVHLPLRETMLCGTVDGESAAQKTASLLLGIGGSAELHSGVGVPATTRRVLTCLGHSINLGMRDFAKVCQEFGDTVAYCNGMAAGVHKSDKAKMAGVVIVTHCPVCSFIPLFELSHVITVSHSCPMHVADSLQHECDNVEVSAVVQERHHGVRAQRP